MRLRDNLFFSTIIIMEIEIEGLSTIDTFIKLSNKKLSDLKTNIKNYNSIYMSNQFDTITEDDIVQLNYLRDLFDDMSLELQIIIDTIQGDDNDTSVIIENTEN
jgi:hypothetical protein